MSGLDMNIDELDEWQGYVQVSSDDLVDPMDDMEWTEVPKEDLVAPNYEAQWEKVPEWVDPIHEPIFIPTLAKGFKSRIGRAGLAASPPKEDPYNGDNPPLPPGQNRTTVGVEFEFSAAVARAEDFIADPHPQDGRYLSEALIDQNDDSARYMLTVRNRVIDVLRENGITAVKTEEKSTIPFKPTRDFGWLNSLDDMEENEKELEKWVGSYNWDPSQGHGVNITAACNQLAQQFVDFHIQNNLEFHKTRNASIDAVSKKVHTFIHRDHVSKPRAATLMAAAVQSLFKLSADEALNQAAEDQKQANEEIDPLCVQLPGMDLKYRTWACTIDYSVVMDGVGHVHYGKLPPGSIYDRKDEDGEWAHISPPFVYKWFPGELRTPILDYNHSETYPAIQKACAALRDAFRIHKPTSGIPSGIHIHIGQEAGWTLLHFKKFTTLWLILERCLQYLHRWDRSPDDNNWCASVRGTSNLNRGLTNPGSRESVHMPDPNTEDAARYDAIMNKHIPVEQLPKDLRSMIGGVWRFNTIADLREALTSSIYDTSAVRCRLEGEKSSNEVEPWNTNTIEFRMMQGTFDAEHIWNWMAVCNSLVIFTRDSTQEEFYNGLGDMYSGKRYPWQVVGVPREVGLWFNSRREGPDHTGFFQYVDKDKVDWADPFMVRGHGDTHVLL
ncbi:putative amidoligase enzyme-domain-containing protein [Hypoxylon trugodes]|uniref:putative amidoligase enzyme-domain-containing protein n=1 Tax=Hypoxylon trugodes TaxID=326681 RepID=UPI002195BB5F|nr:putative amidoligase enzyme-domain-containing protein [Hypoxylon trugodes]KAI1386767.1 putative amidoligase enzyme-domain-containing protein [Hypoxylon trugodes]